MRRPAMERFEPTAEICDRLGGQVQVCHAPLRRYGGRIAAAGPMACVQVFEDAGLVREMLEQPGEGRILVVDGGGSVRRALLGDRMAQLALQNGWQGVVINGAVRDVAALAALPMAVLALGAVPVRAAGAGNGASGIELMFGEASFAPGQWLHLDADGVVLLPPDGATRFR